MKPGNKYHPNPCCCSSPPVVLLASESASSTAQIGGPSLLGPPPANARFPAAAAMAHPPSIVWRRLRSVGAVRSGHGVAVSAVSVDGRSLSAAFGRPKLLHSFGGAQAERRHTRRRPRRCEMRWPSRHLFHQPTSEDLPSSVIFPLVRDRFWVHQPTGSEHCASRCTSHDHSELYELIGEVLSTDKLYI